MPTLTHQTTFGALQGSDGFTGSLSSDAGDASDDLDHADGVDVGAYDITIGSFGISSNYIVGLNLAPHDLASRVQRAFTVPADLRLHVERVRPLHFPQAIFWLQGTFVSDQKEQEIVLIAIDLHYGRRCVASKRCWIMHACPRRPVCRCWKPGI